MSPRSLLYSVIVTRGDRDLHPAFNLLPNLRVWNNAESHQGDQMVYGRYRMVSLLTCGSNQIFYTQDDDVIAPARELIEAYQPGEFLVNMPQAFQDAYAGTGISLVGFGAVFPAELAVQALERYLRHFPEDDLFRRECDRIVTYLNADKVRMVDFGKRDLPHAKDPDRMYHESRHEADLAEIRRRLRIVWSR